MKKQFIMKAFIKSSIFFFALALFVLRTNAQQVTMAVDSMTGFPDTALCCTQQYNFTIDVRNFSSVQFGGVLNIMYRTDQMNASDSGGVFNANGLFDTISAFGSTTITVSNFSFDSLAGFRTGGNVVVVWPVCSSGISVFVTDTFYASVFVENGQGINEPKATINKINIYPIPANEKIFIQNQLTEKSIEYVRIIDIIGTEVFNAKTLPSFINTSFLRDGVYFIEIKNKNEIPVISKFIISR